VVVDELDAKKYARREEFQDRSRELLSVINRLTTDDPDAYAKISDSLTVEVLPDEEGHLRAPSNDQEILERCELLTQVTGKPITLITGDSGVRINARSRGMNVFQLTDDDLLPSRKPAVPSDGEAR
jgi:predicted ribonuclease YlaK